MRYLFQFLSDPFKKILALFILGVVIGSAMTNLAIGYQLDKLYSQKLNLEAQLADKEEQIKVLEEKVSEANRWLIVQEIQVEITLPERSFPDKQQLELEIEKIIKNILKNVRGQKVSQLDPMVIWNIVDQRKVEVLGYQFTLEVQGIIVSEKVVFYIFAKYHDPLQQEEPI
ncbi:MAG: hypothetical protein GXY91_09355 [Clostridia bacterium]|nr:hypothetical protein [Clostridia bacterium]